MNPKSMTGRRLAVIVDAVERASTWELFDEESLPPIPAWVKAAGGAGLVLAGILSLIGTLRGGL